MVGPAVKREGVAHLRATMGLSERRACSIVSAMTARWSVTAHVGRQTRSFRGNCAISPTRGGVSDIVGCSSCCGRRASPRASTASTGFIAKKASRCASDGLGGAPWGREAPILVESKPNARWSVDFVHDQLACGRRLRILNIVDDVTRECLAAIPDTSISGRRVARELTALIKRRQARHDRVRQWDRVHLERHVRLGAGQHGRLAFHCARKADAEWLLREFQRAHARRASQREPVPRPRSGPDQQRSRTGSTITTSDGRTRRWAISHRWPMPPISPQHAIGCATPTSSADRMLLHPRPTA